MHDVFVDVGSGAGGEECNEPNQVDTINHGKKLDQNSSMPHFRFRNIPIQNCLFGENGQLVEIRSRVCSIKQLNILGGRLGIFVQFRLEQKECSVG